MMEKKTNKEAWKGSKTEIKMDIYNTVHFSWDCT